MDLALIINGRSEVLAGLTTASPLAAVITILGLKSDRIAVEHNGAIVPRDRWSELALEQGDRLEIVHFVGGGVGQDCVRPAKCFQQAGGDFSKTISWKSRLHL